MSSITIQDLSVEYKTEDGPLRAVNDVSLSVEEGEIFGIVGESGCGKTTLMKAVLDLLPDNGRVVSGDIDFQGHNLTALPNKELRTLRWEEMSYIIQNAMNALDPVHKIGSQFVEVIRTHRDVSRSEARSMARSLLTDVGIEEHRVNDYPHELSGGQRQRVVIALALALSPELVIADEPTTGLDVVIQDEILSLIQEMQNTIDNSMIIITHDISVVAEVTDRVAVMYGGEIVEIGKTTDVFKQTSHPYTMGLTNAFPSLERGITELVSIPGSPPDLVNPPSGCRFIDRCPFATEKCEEKPPLENVSEDHFSRCHYNDCSEEFRTESNKLATWQGATQ